MHRSFESPKKTTELVTICLTAYLGIDCHVIALITFENIGILKLDECTGMHTNRPVSVDGVNKKKGRHSQTVNTTRTSTSCCGLPSRLGQHNISEAGSRSIDAGQLPCRVSLVTQRYVCASAPPVAPDLILIRDGCVPPKPGKTMVTLDWVRMDDITGTICDPSSSPELTGGRL